MISLDTLTFFFTFACVFINLYRTLIRCKFLSFSWLKDTLIKRVIFWYYQRNKQTSSLHGLCGLFVKCCVQYPPHEVRLDPSTVHLQVNQVNCERLWWITGHLFTIYYSVHANMLLDYFKHLLFAQKLKARSANANS